MWGRLRYARMLNWARNRQRSAEHAPARWFFGSAAIGCLLLGLANAGRREHHADATEEFEARRQAVAAATEQLKQLAAQRALPQAVVTPLLAALHDRFNNLEHRIDGVDSHRKVVELYDDIELTLIGAERRVVNDLYRDGKLKYEARRRIERELDLREEGLENLRAAE